VARDCVTGNRNFGVSPCTVRDSCTRNIEIHEIHTAIEQRAEDGAAYPLITLRFNVDASCG